MKTKILLLTAMVILGCTAASRAQSVPAYVPTNGLVGWWPFNGNANDESGNGNNGAVSGAVSCVDRLGLQNSAYSFSTSSSKILVNNTFFDNGWGDYTISIWFNPFNNAVNGVLLNTIPHDGFGLGYSYYGTNKKLYHSKNSEPVQHVWDIFNADPFNQPQFDFNTWYHVMIIKNVNTYSYFVNGVLDKVIASSLSPVSFNCGLVIGNIDPSIVNPEPFNGVLDDIGIWNRALTQQEITNLYNAGICYQYVTVTDTLLINTNLTGFNPVTYQNTIRIYPNPSNDHITIDYGNFASLNGYQLLIENSLGQQMFQTAINQQSSYISLNGWTGNGLYFVHIIDPQGNTVDVRKIVLQ